MFKKFTVYRWRRDLILDNIPALVEALKTYAPRPLHKLEMSNSSFEKPFPTAKSPIAFISGLGYVSEAFTQPVSLQAMGDVSDAILLLHHFEEKVILGQYVNRLVNKKIEELSQREGRVVTRGEKLEIREEVIEGLKPRAQTRVTLTPILIIPQCDTRKRPALLIVGNVATAAERATSSLRQVLGTLPIVPAVGKTTVEYALTRLVSGTVNFPSFQLSEDFQLMADKSKCRVVGVHYVEDVNGLTDMLEGNTVTHAKLRYLDEMTFSVDPKLRASSIKVLDILDSGPILEMDLIEELDKEDESVSLEDSADVRLEIDRISRLANSMFTELLQGYEDVKELEAGSEPLFVDSYFKCGQVSKEVEQDAAQNS